MTRKTARKATTFRIEPVTMSGLEKLSSILNKPLNKLANEAISEYVARRISEVAVDLSSTLEDLRAYLKNDPRFERSIREFVEAEASATRDPMEGTIVSKNESSEAGPTERQMLKLLNG
jgi:predicted transcriptional regulator